jgi:uncharacterized membrane protein YhaH (DUF805 family)
MASSNPYSPPRAEVADIGAAYDGGFQEMKVWSWRGRLGRLRFLAYTAVAYLVYALVIAALGVMAGMSGSSGVGSGLLVGAIWLLLIPYLVFGVLVMIRRSHDMGWSGWMSILAFIPLVGLIWLFKAGSPGANDYGAPPPPNTTGIKVAAFGIFGLLMVVGILAAIAVPAYQSYVQRAQAAQQVPAK